MPKVLVLADHIASQIAAGEVVERPASVVKELVENSLDSGATRIEVAVSDGCRDIRVADNGCGMDSDDALLAFHRHATSKLTCADDLWKLNSLGFRGEALPSIASVAKVTCYTRTHDASLGHKIQAAEGKVTASETGCAPGTVMEITDLFYNVPARLSFLKQAATEFGHIKEIVQSLSITYPEVAFHLLHDRDTALKTTGSGDLAQVVREAALFSQKDELYEVSLSDGDTEIFGFVGRPTQFRGDRKGILAIINNRPVRCPLTYKALDYAYSDLIPRGRYPLAIIKVTTDPQQVDINIHPTKKEIKYANGNEVYVALQRALMNALREVKQERQRETDQRHEPDRLNEHQAHDERLRAQSWTTEKPATAPLVESDLAVSLVSEHRASALNSDTAQGLGQALNEGAHLVSESESPQQLRFRDSLKYVPESSQDPWTPVHSYTDPAPADRSSTGGLSIDPAYTNHSSSSPWTTDSVYAKHLSCDFPPTDVSSEMQNRPCLPAGWRIAGYLHNTYIVVETSEGLALIEQHIAHERTLYERLLAKQSTTGRVTDYSQQLIISAPLNLTSSQQSALDCNRHLLQNLGFDFELEGSEWLCTQVPIELAHKNYTAVVQELLEQLAIADSANLELEATKSIACQSAIKNGMPLSESAIIRLLADWQATPRNDTCPHGRPIMLEFSLDQLFQMFHPA